MGRSRRAAVALAAARAWGLAALAATAPLAACQEAHVNLDQAGAQVLAGVPDAALQRAAQRRVFFGHQSVGHDLVKGLALLGEERPAARLRVVESRSVEPLATPALLHAPVGKNRDPSGKLRDFEAALAGGLGAKVDVALVKLCFIDFSRGADPDQLFAEYRATMARLHAAYPKLRILHVTTPLTTVQSGPRAAVKKLLGRPLWGAPENLLRERYNALLRAEYEGKEPFFDLARVEATLPGGAGLSPPALAPQWASDEGHLNPAGARWASAHLLRALAAIGD